MSKYLFILFHILSASTPVYSFDQVVPGRTFDFPKDHGSHPEFETEWWYYTGHLVSENNETFGFQLTFFRVGIHPEEGSRSPRSAWHTHSVHLAHFALTDDKNRKFYHYEKTNRESFDMAGAKNDHLHVWNGSWESRMSGSDILLSVKTEDVDLELGVSSLKPVILQGSEGFSRKGAEPGEASYYYSYTRLNGSGELKVKNQKYNIKAASVWMDREFTSSKLAQATQGWDWFAIQLDSGEDIMVYQLRDKNNNPNEFSSGSYIDQEGNKTHLDHTDFQIKVLSYWKSPKSGIAYPSEWKISVRGSGKELHIKPSIPDQELITQKSTGVNYWEGRCLVYENGKHAGNAYVELVGYK
jgi:predicted secreted hydrolase